MLTEDQIAYVARAALEEYEMQRDGLDDDPLLNDAMNELLAEVSKILSGDAPEPVTVEDRLLHAVVVALAGA